VAARRLYPPHRPHRPRGIEGHRDHAGDSADADAVAQIEKLTGLKIARVDAGAPAGEAEPRPSRARNMRNASRHAGADESPPPPPSGDRAPERDAAPRPEREKKAPPPRHEPEVRHAEPDDDEYRPTVEPGQAEDAEPAWNGPVPSFLNFGAG